MPRSLALVSLLLAALPAAAGDIVGYVPNDPTSIATFDRFPNGIGSPTPNTSGGFVGAGLDLSGIGWRTDLPQLAVSLLAARSLADPSQVVGRYFVGAFHVGVGATLTFADNQGTHTYTVAATQRLTTNGAPSDVIIGRLTTAPSADGIRPLPLAGVTATTAVGLDAYAYVQNASYGADRRQLGLATIGAVQEESFPASNPTGPSPTVTALWQRDPNRTGSVLLTGGDSGGPLFTRGQSGETALIGAHFGTDGQSISASSFLPDPGYVQQINDFMLADGYQVLIVPVPEPAGVLVVGLAGGWAVGRWRRPRRAAHTPA